jgi:hypothetical protein
LEKNLKVKIGKPGGKLLGRRYKNESAYSFSGGKQKGNQGRYNSTGQSQPQTYQGNFKSKKNAVNKYWKKFKGHCTCFGMQGHKAIDCGVQRQTMNASSGHKVKNQKNQVLSMWKARSLWQKLPREKNNNLPCQPLLFVGHVGEDSVYMLGGLASR